MPKKEKLTTDCLTVDSFWAGAYRQTFTHPCIRETTKRWFRELAQIPESDQRRREHYRWAIARINYPLCTKWLQRYGHMTNYEELCEAALDALYRCTKTFNIERGTEFSTYGTWAVRKAIGRAAKLHVVHNQRFQAVDEVYDRPEPKPEVSVLEESQRMAQFVFGTRSLTDQERFVMLARAGFYEDVAPTLIGIGKALGVSKERARQVHQYASHRLRPMANALLE